MYRTDLTYLKACILATIKVHFETFAEPILGNSLAVKYSRKIKYAGSEFPLIITELSRAQKIFIIVSMRGSKLYYPSYCIPYFELHSEHAQWVAQEYDKARRYYDSKRPQLKTNSDVIQTVKLGLLKYLAENKLDYNVSVSDSYATEQEEIPRQLSLLEKPELKKGDTP
jgi:hypothetical protein